jgi:retinol dehydrogenase-14
MHTAQANVLFTNELARRLPAGGPTATALHPGVVNTELQRWLLPDAPAWWQRPLLAAGAALALTPAQGAATSVYLAT